MPDLITPDALASASRSAAPASGQGIVPSAYLAQYDRSLSASNGARAGTARAVPTVFRLRQAAAFSAAGLSD